MIQGVMVIGINQWNVLKGDAYSDIFKNNKISDNLIICALLKLINDNKELINHTLKYRLHSQAQI